VRDKIRSFFSVKEQQKWASRRSCAPTSKLLPAPLLAADVVISGKQSTVNVASLPRQLQQQLDEAFVVEPVDTVLSVVSVQLQTIQLCVNELYVVEISPHDEVLMFVFVTHIIEHDGLGCMWFTEHS
jgi:hypothetical protein